jgi:hypothetical protein
MSGNLDVFALTDDEAMKMIVCESHIGTKTCDFQMENYVWKRRQDGIIKPIIKNFETNFVKIRRTHN